MKKTMLFALAIILCFCFFSNTEMMAEAAFVEEGNSENESVNVNVNVNKHPIDMELEKRLGDAVTTIDMIEAFKETLADWDKLLNVNYNALMKKLSKEQQDKLRASQREWIKFRDLEFAFNADFNAGLGGTVRGVDILAFQCSFVRERALALGAYLEELQGM